MNHNHKTWLTSKLTYHKVSGNPVKKVFKRLANRTFRHRAKIKLNCFNEDTTQFLPYAAGYMD